LPKKSLAEKEVGTKKRKMNAKGIGVLVVIVMVLYFVSAAQAQPLEIVFDTDEGAYPSIMGVHKGYFTPNHNISVHQIYTYPCAGTGGHSEYVAFYDENGNEIGAASWDGYQSDYHNIRFDIPLTLYKGVVYSYEFRTGSYPQIIHNQTLENEYGTINCTSFVDANGRSYSNRIPAIRLEGYFVDGAGVHNIDSGKNFSTIQAAIEDSDTQDNHTIEVYAGTYVGNVVVTKRLTLRGIGMPTVDANGSGSAITIGVDGCVVDGFNVRGASTGSEFDFPGIKVTSDGNTLGNNTASNNFCGIWLYMSSNNTIINNNLHSNNWGILLLWGSSHNNFTNNIVSNNSVGISVCFSGSNIITNNTVNSNSGYGITFELGSKNRIYHNNFVDNTNQAGEVKQGGYLYPSNSWDSGPVEGGNYWSDHECTGNPSDGGQPYNIRGIPQDRYPFEDPWGWIKNES
jgi:parallel beta-helix repeat protein